MSPLKIGLAGTRGVGAQTQTLLREEPRSAYPEPLLRVVSSPPPWLTPAPRPA